MTVPPPFPVALKGWLHYGHAKVWVGRGDCPSLLLGTRLWLALDVWTSGISGWILNASCELFLLKSQSCRRNNSIQIPEVAHKSFILENAKFYT